MTMVNRRMEASIKTSDDFRRSRATLQRLYVQETGGNGGQCNQYQYNDEQWGEIKQTKGDENPRSVLVYSRCEDEVGIANS